MTTEKTTLREIGITDADNIHLTPETLDLPIARTLSAEGVEIYILSDAEGIVINYLSGPTAWYESLEDAVGAAPQAFDDWPMVEGCLVLEPNQWHANDGNFETVEEHDSAQEAAQAYVDGGDWGDNTQTTWINVCVWREGLDLDGNLREVDEQTIKIRLDPDEPECKEGQEHDWQSPQSIVGGLKENPGVFGSGGGVTIHQVCMRCGLAKVTDTWAQDPSDGVQGLESVEYRPDAVDTKLLNRWIIESRNDGPGATGFVPWDPSAIGENEPRTFASCESDIAAFRAGDCGSEFAEFYADDDNWQIVEAW